MSRFFVSISVLLFTVMAQAQTTKATAPTTTPPAATTSAPAPSVFNPADMANPNDWKRQYFDLVVVINRNAGVQTLDAYYKGAWVKHVEVSTALEESLSGTNLDGTPFTMFADTPTGYFPVTPGALQIDHHSTAFDDSYMPFAVFFDQSGGIATHEAPPGAETLLGKRASHGCVRMPREDAIDLFFLVAMTGGPVSPSKFVGECPAGYNDVNACEAAAHQATVNDQALAQVALIQAGSKGIEPYATSPTIPKVSRTGQLTMDKTGAVEMQPGYRTLYIVQDVPLAPGASKTPPNAPTSLVLNIPAQDDKCLIMSTKYKDTWGKYIEELSSRCYYEPTGPSDEQPQQQFFPNIFGNGNNSFFNSRW